MLFNQIDILLIKLSQQNYKVLVFNHIKKTLRCKVFLVEHSGLEPLTSTLPVLRSPS